MLPEVVGAQVVVRPEVGLPVQASVDKGAHRPRDPFRDQIGLPTRQVEHRRGNELGTPGVDELLGGAPLPGGLVGAEQREGHVAVPAPPIARAVLDRAGPAGRSFLGQGGVVGRPKWRTLPRPPQLTGSLRSGSWSLPARRATSRRRPAVSTDRSRISRLNCSVPINATAGRASLARPAGQAAACRGNRRRARGGSRALRR